MSRWVVVGRKEDRNEFCVKYRRTHTYVHTFINLTTDDQIQYLAKRFLAVK